ncbi:DEAD/DEAH box helicase [Candidatus Parcubacteria bacterium]|uniref:ATP-dependent helicase n=1 Tax=Candidatus Kaiserbacteria bacterium CG10_big_fil_rev_8_21_14_0_10_47_16 TaxID=1974608 RepID=A0A2H0UD46_9BACT|nr:DEAD/DEAH box helicase [Candidatus Parcubacteria bacterium]PIR84307.1 MAG: ATP-dependent helicase [Candidatus Kaiserbacteria bacterium CG10_big_fil_rev_8_21_14_0_10_47_16]
MDHTTSRPSRNSSSRSGSRPSYGGANKRSSFSDRRGRGGNGGGSSFSSNRSPRGGSSRSGGGSGSSRGRGGRMQKSFDVSQYINKNPVIQETAEVYVPEHKFTEFGLDKKLAFTVTSSGLVSPTPIQDQIIPHILEGRDVIGLANTGTGKTAAFLIPLIDKTLREYNRQTLILAPTRELAIQIQEELRKLSGQSKIYSTICVGGTSIRPQIQGLRRKNHFIIGTPGRVLDLINQGYLKPQHIRTVVLDEADRMLDMGFIHDMRKILQDIPKDKETLFFSATMSADIERLVSDFLRNPITVSVKKKDITGSIEQDVVRHGNHDKFQTLVTLLKDTETFKRVIIFGAMKHSVEKLGQALNAAGITAESIHGNKSHPQRQRALKNFKSGQSRVLVATDVAARGIHVDNVTHVINYDLPNCYEDYVHRIGRTGRGEKLGKALTFVA